MAECVRMILAAALVLLSIGVEAKVYPPGRAFPSVSLKYVKDRFKEVNPDLVWDQKNYLEALAADYASCNYNESIIYSYANMPQNTSYSVFVEDQPMAGYGRSDVIKNLEPIINDWVKMKRYNTQIENASIFACSVSPGCGHRENKMGVACVFAPASKPYVYNPDDYDEEKPQNVLAEQNEPVPLTIEDYHKGEDITESKWDQNKFLENLSLLETNCSLLEKEKWDFEKAKSIVNGLGLKLSGSYGAAEIVSNDRDAAMERIFQQMKRDLPPSVQIGCSLIRNCVIEAKEFAVSTCVYEEKCRREICL